MPLPPTVGVTDDSDGSLASRRKLRPVLSIRAAAIIGSEAARLGIATPVRRRGDPGFRELLKGGGSNASPHCPSEESELRSMTGQAFQLGLVGAEKLPRRRGSNR